MFHTKYLSDQTLEITLNIWVHITAIGGSVQPWPESVRAYFEQQFGVNFSLARLHSDTQAAESYSIDIPIKNGRYMKII